MTGIVGFDLIHKTRIIMQGAKRPWSNSEFHLKNMSAWYTTGLVLHLAWNRKSLLRQSLLKVFKNTISKFWIVCPNFFLITSYKSSSIWPVTLFENFSCGSPKSLALELRADLVEWAENLFGSISDRASTSIIDPDNVDVEIDPWGSRKLNKSCDCFSSCSSSMKYKSMITNTHLLFSVNK